MSAATPPPACRPAPSSSARRSARVGDALAGTPAPSVVVHGINPIYTRWDEEALPAALAGMDLAERLGARFMLPGNVYNYGEAMPALLDETTPQRPTTAKGGSASRWSASSSAAPAPAGCARR